MFPWFPWLFFYAPNYNFGRGWKWQIDSSHEQLWGSLFQITLQTAAKTNQTADTVSAALSVLKNNLNLNGVDREQLQLHIDKLNDLKKP